MRAPRWCGFSNIAVYALLDARISTNIVHLWIEFTYRMLANGYCSVRTECKQLYRYACDMVACNYGLHSADSIVYYMLYAHIYSRTIGRITGVRKTILIFIRPFSNVKFNSHQK